MPPKKKFVPFPSDVKQPKGRRLGSQIDNAVFMAEAGVIRIMIDGQGVPVNPRVFSTGSVGWYTNGKLTVLVNGKQLTVQFNVSAVVIGSRPGKYVGPVPKKPKPKPKTEE